MRRLTVPLARSCSSPLAPARRGSPFCRGSLAVPEGAEPYDVVTFDSAGRECRVPVGPAVLAGRIRRPPRASRSAPRVPARVRGRRPRGAGDRRCARAPARRTATPQAVARSTGDRLLSASPSGDRHHAESAYLETSTTLASQRPSSTPDAHDRPAAKSCCCHGRARSNLARTARGCVPEPGRCTCSRTGATALTISTKSPGQRQPSTRSPPKSAGAFPNLPSRHHPTADFGPDAGETPTGDQAPLQPLTQLWPSPVRRDTRPHDLAADTGRRREAWP